MGFYSVVVSAEQTCPFTAAFQFSYIVRENISLRDGPFPNFQSDWERCNGKDYIFPKTGIDLEKNLIQPRLFPNRPGY